jgi:N-acetylglucosamine-6-sulfatase
VAFVHPVDRVPQSGLSGPLAYKAVRTRTHKYVRYINKKCELYDLEADPYELESIHETADPSLVANLKAKLDALRTCAGQSCRRAEDIP